MRYERFRELLGRLHAVATLPAAGVLWSGVLMSIAILVLGVSVTAVYLPRAIDAAIGAAYQSGLATANQVKLPSERRQTLTLKASSTAELAAVEQGTQVILWTLCGVAAIAAFALLGIATLVEYRTRQKRDADTYVQFLAYHDSLTGLANRASLKDRLQRALSRPRQGSGVAVLCLDLDRFKEVNDTLGHPTGDALLKMVAQRLRTCVRDTDTVARTSGDEFVVVQIVTEPKAAEALAARLISVLGEPFGVNRHQVMIGGSIGIAVSPNDGTEADILLKHADLALYRSKSQGRGTYCFFEEEMDTRMQLRRNLEQDLRNALRDGEFTLHYQPIVNLERDRVSALEALLRWRHPERGWVSPSEFMPVAEETGLIVSIGEWVLRQACTQAATWPNDVKLAVNLSAVQFKKNGTLVQVVSNALAESGLAANRLELEITETALLQNTYDTLVILHELRAAGVCIALDDFGTGYSSLSYLRRFPFDKIKIDRQFIAELSDTTVGSLAIVRAVARLASALGMSTTAEGVETEAQLECVRAEGCTEIQGYFLSRPKPASEIAEMFSLFALKQVMAA